MKKIIYTLMSIMLAAQVSCVDEKVFDEFKVSVSPDAVISKTQISVVDANDAFANVGDATITFTDETQSGNIYTVGGTAAVNNAFEIEDGYIILGVVASEVVNVSNPLTINATISSAGYLDRNVDFVFMGADINTFSVKLLNETNLPTGVTYDAATLTLNPTSEIASEFIGVQTVAAGVTASETTDAAKLSSINGVLNRNLGYQPTSSWVASQSINNQTDLDTAITTYKDTYSVNSNDDVYIKVAGEILAYTNYVDGTTVTGYGAGKVVTNPCTDLPANITFVNNGLSGKYRYSAKVSDVNIGSGAFILSGFSETSVSTSEFSGLNFKGLTSLLADNLALEIEVYSYDNEAWESVYSTEGQTLCDLSSVDVTNLDASTDEFGELNLKIDCPDLKVSFDNTVVDFSIAGENDFRTFGIIRNGIILNKVPVIDENTSYEFRIWYEGYKISTPILGSVLKNNGIVLDNICDEVSDLSL